MIPHIIQERSVEQNVQHKGEGARCASTDDAEEPQRSPSRPCWGINLYSCTERWRESKDPGAVTSASPDHCGERAPMLICLWNPTLSFFFFLKTVLASYSSVLFLFPQFTVSARHSSEQQLRYFFVHVRHFFNLNNCKL